MSDSSGAVEADLTEAETSRSETQRIPIAQRLIDQDVAVKKARLYRRLSICWLTLGNLLILSLIVAGNLLIDYSDPGDGRKWLNWTGTILFLASTTLAAISTFEDHRSLQEQRAVLLKLKEERKQACRRVR